MARPLRCDFAGARHHVMCRTVPHAPRLDTPAAWEIFDRTLTEAVARYQIVIHAFAVMPNHYHLMLETPLGNVSVAMKYINQVLAQRLNRTQQPVRVGALWGQRFKNRVVETDAYWTHLVAYLHLNPVRAGLVERASRARWTSHRVYQGREPAPPWLTTEHLLRHFGSLEELESYVASVEGHHRAPKGFDPRRLWPRRNDPPPARPIRESHP